MVAMRASVGSSRRFAVVFLAVVAFVGATAASCTPEQIEAAKRFCAVNPCPPHKTTTTAGATTTLPATTTTSPGTYRSVVLADTPLAYWRFATTDSETGTHNGTLRGSPLLNQPGPFAGSPSIRFDGVERDNATTQGFLVNSLARLSSATWANGFAIEAWAKTTTSGPEQHVVTWNDAAGNAGPGLMYDDPDDRWKYRDGNVSLSQNGTTTINAWHHLVASIDASGAGTLYVDGVAVRTWTSGVRPLAASTALFTVGADYDSHDCPCPHVSSPFNGWLAETAIYNHPLTAARVQAHFGGTPTTTTTTTASTTTTTQPPAVGAFLSYPHQSGRQTFSGTNVVVANRSYVGFRAGACLTVSNAHNVHVHDVDFDQCGGGVFLINVTGTVTVERIRARDTGNGSIGSGQGNVVQTNNVFTCNGRIRNVKAYGGDTEDVISIFQSGGCDATHPLVVSDVHVEHPLSGPLAWSSGSGTCANLADAGGHDIRLENSTFLNCGAVGIQMNEPTRVVATGNVVYGAPRTTSNVGLSQWSSGSCASCTGNLYSNNSVNWKKASGSQSDIWLSGNYPVSLSGNTTNANIELATLRVVL